MSNNKQSSVDKEFAPYEEALALKELGFDQPCFGYFILGQLFVTSDTVYNSLCIPVCKAPTYSQAFRWFRENHNLKSCIMFRTSMADNEEYYDWLIKGQEVVYRHFKTYEEAELACLKKLIEIVKGGNK
jgi:hypothetical protein